MANNSTSQYGRKLKLIVADDTGNGLDLSSLKVTFKVKKLTRAHLIVQLSEHTIWLKIPFDELEKNFHQWSLKRDTIAILD